MGLLGWLKPKDTNVEVDTYDYVVPNTEIAMPVNRRRTTRKNARPGTQALLIDEDSAALVKLNTLLTSAGFITFTAKDAESGLELARKEMPQIIFLEAVLPGMHGFSLLRKLRRDPELQHIPVMLMSASEKAAEYFYQHNVDADDFMKKPFSRQEVFARIEALLDERSIPRRARVTERGPATVT